MLKRQRNSLAVFLVSRSILGAWVLLAVGFGLSMSGQIPVSTVTPGSAFRAGPKGRATDAADGRHFRADGFVSLNVDGLFRLPPDAGTKVTRITRLVIHFRTSKNGPSLRSIEIRNGASVAWKLEKQFSGDFSIREVPGANAFVFGDPGPGRPASSLAGPLIRVGTGSTIRLEVQYPGGFEGIKDAGEFVITNVVTNFEPKPIVLSDRATADSANSALGLGNAGKPAGTPAGPPPASPAPAGQTPVSVASNNVIYIVSNTNDLLWYGHTGREDGIFRWATSVGQRVGIGWDFKQLFAGDDGVIYGINANNDLLWYRHDGHLDGTFRWGSPTAKKVGSGWNFKQVFYGGGGVIYAITQSNDLLWFRHDGRADGSFRWAASEGKKVGSGWNFKQVFSGGGGVIYAINENNDLLWFRHDGRGDGTFRWAAPAGKKVGSGWDFKQVFSSGDGVIYAIPADRELLWFRHDGIADGTFRWAVPKGKQVGSGWEIKQIFSGANLRP
ncbi:MAG: Tachylectin [Acidobacteriaceae bacterium]|nr:Tachylectin [Acidobacteriaceae bacterium]